MLRQNIVINFKEVPSILWMQKKFKSNIVNFSRIKGAF